ncbi:MAG: hypothetical protein V3W41_17350 [Planctomycetota bacterium]
MLISVCYAFATLAMLLIFAGLAFARDRRRHVPLMFAAFACDIIGLIIVEIVVPIAEGRLDPVRGLMESGGSGAELIDNIHAALATLSIVGYIIQIVTGIKIMKGRGDLLALHKKAAVFFILTRLAAYITMWMV